MPYQFCIPKMELYNHIAPQEKTCREKSFSYSDVRQSLHPSHSSFLKNNIELFMC